MKTTKLIGIVAVLSILATVVQAEDPVYFPDANLKAAVEQALGIADPTPTDMLALSSLYAHNRGIASLIGIEHAVNLAVLGLRDNQISDLGPLSGLMALDTLFLERNQITDLSQLSGLANLSTLFLRQNQISDFSVVGTMPNLQRLDIGNNPVNDISFLAGMTQLVVLEIGYTQISDISILTELPNLQRLNISHLPITDISLLSGMTGLTALVLNDNPQVTNFTTLSSLTGLNHLILNHNQITSLQFIQDMTQLNELDVVGNQISDISVLSGMTNMQSLELQNNQISDISVLANMTDLFELRIQHNLISDLSPLSQLYHLDRLDLQYNPLNSDACTIYIPQIIQNNPGITLWQNTCPDPGSLLVNGGFESGSKSPWNQYANPPVVIKTGVVQELTGASVPEDPIEGNYCLHVEVSETSVNFWDAGVAYVGLAYTAGKRYTLSAYLKCKEGSLPINFKLELSMDPWTGYWQQFTMTDEWAEYSFTSPVFVSDVSPSQVTFHVGFEPGEFWMDNIRLVEEDAPPDIVYFTDQNFKQAVIDALAGIGIYTSDPTESQMAYLTQIYAHNRGITDLTGIEYAVNLTLLAANNNQISNLAPLAGLTNLTYLELRKNLVSDLSPLSGLTNLTTLNFHGYQISDVSPLATLTNLTTLVLERNQISDISSLSGLTNLTELRLWSNPITDISPLSGLTNLTILTMAGTQVSDITILSAMTNLTTLVLENSQISDVSPLSGLTNLTELRLWSNQITDISPLSGLTNLTLLTIGQNQIEIIPALPVFAKMASLDLNDNMISDISGLAGLTNITFLELSHNQISNVSALSGITNLTELRLSGNQINDISPLAGLTALVNLRLDGNQITDITPLANMIQMETLLLKSNQISDISALAGMTKMTLLHLIDNQITDISALVNLSNVVELNFERNEIADLSPLTNMTNLQMLICNYNNVSDLEPLKEMTTLTRLWLLGCPLSPESCFVWIPIIRANNPGIDLPYDAYSNDSVQIWLDAEGGSIGSPMEIWDDATAFGGQFIQVSSGNSTSWPPSDGYATYGFSIPTGTYMVWGRIIAPTPEDDSFWVRIQGASTNTNNHASGWVRWNNISPGSNWLWDAVHSSDDGGTIVQFTLSEGSYTLEIAYREDGAKLDHLLITDYLNLTAEEISRITPTGAYTEVAPVDSQTGETPVTLTFENIIDPGETSLTTSTSGPPVPTGFQLLDIYYDIETTATFTDTIQIGIEYDDSGLTPEEELALKLWHYNDTLEQWIDVTTGIDTTNNIIYGETDHLSSFVITVNIVVGIDIKPGSYPNSFNLNGNGLIPVAILGSADFDVTQIDVSTLSLEGLEVRVKPNGTPQCSVEDVSGKEGMPDGHSDLVCQFVDNPDNWLLGDTEEAKVTGYLKEEFGGIFIEGSDEIRIVP